MTQVIGVLRNLAKILTGLVVQLYQIYNASDIYLTKYRPCTVRKGKNKKAQWTETISPGTDLIKFDNLNSDNCLPDRASTYLMEKTENQ